MSGEKKKKNCSFVLWAGNITGSSVVCNLELILLSVVEESCCLQLSRDILFKFLSVLSKTGIRFQYVAFSLQNYLISFCFQWLVIETIVIFFFSQGIGNFVLVVLNRRNFGILFVILFLNLHCSDYFLTFWSCGKIRIIFFNIFCCRTFYSKCVILRRL